ncbi:hypothetical protein BU16DRAFT_578124 [Lophium mytilinum]|uniref:Uncharacterized protein n=1 Tax=Lophium mytilinum TaxID=390894 RepID=A0A6A6R8L8_9PEZI|nr:hypothetical protein BU16DRAFT_578124 [Lophium mytilinum]
MATSRSPSQSCEDTVAFQDQDSLEGLQDELVEVHPYSNPAGPTLMDGIEVASQPETVGSRKVAAEIAPDTLPVPPHGGSEFEPEVQSSPCASEVASYDELQSELTKERGTRVNAENELRKMETELKDIRQRWKLTARELGIIQRKGQGSGFYQVTDDYLIGLITRLRYNIQNISIQYFSERLGRASRPPKNGVLYAFMRSTTPGSDDFLEYLTHPALRPKVIEAFFWRVLVSRLFYNFKWAGRTFLSMWELYRVLEPSHHANTDWKACPNPEAEKKYHIWRSNTVALLLDSMDEKLSHKADETLPRWKARFFDQVGVMISSYRASHVRDYREEFMRIIDEALELDKEISRQVTGIQFLFQAIDSNPDFDCSTMEREKGVKVSGNKQKVLLVTSPAVVKRGRSTGEGFNEATLLLRSELLCEDRRT